MDLAVAAFGLGALLLVIGLVGGNLEYKGVKVPKVGVIPRFLTTSLSIPFFLTGIGLSVLQSGSEPVPPPTTPPSGIVTPTDPPANPVRFQLLAGLRPEYGEVFEEAVLMLDGQKVAEWRLEATAAPTATLDVEARRAGVQQFALTGRYAYNDPYGFPRFAPVTGTGTIDLQPGVVYTVVYYAPPGPGTFGIQRR